MASDFSFDIVSQIDLQAIDDAVNISMKEIVNRYDLKGTNSIIEFNRTEKTVTLSAGSDFHLKQIKAILISKMAKRGVSNKSLSVKKTETNLSGAIRETNNLVCGIEKELAKSIVKDIKTLNIKVQASIQEEQIRVSSRVKDDLQSVISFIKSKDYPIPLQFVNYR
ncbi:MAG: YajQ family cyclic di-GMP-binding protein [Elusimicrobia bacterium RIFOXYC2_FULL_34_12]|nr:MAG: YajQ family cyclic di-GMP-binding protein [Elusimicrobia bacterium RIFOXYC2_FULL_34_12]OGS39650.1 MAG: YajQ family cyclic di-GMP-binding protein [Elusimicrobia bacterium RIFOXYD2_FULL_34_30]HAM39151.1 YajQ family cyclic di-GMP-binding protein [Elusimicrobiota bacterium]